MVDKGIPRPGYPIQDASGSIIGIGTSGTMSPTMDKGIGMGYVMTEFKSPGTEIMIEVRNKTLKAVVVKLPIFKG